MIYDPGLHLLHTRMSYFKVWSFNRVLWWKYMYHAWFLCLQKTIRCHVIDNQALSVGGGFYIVLGINLKQIWGFNSLNTKRFLLKLRSVNLKLRTKYLKGNRIPLWVTYLCLKWLSKMDQMMLLQESINTPKVNI